MNIIDRIINTISLGFSEDAPTKLLHCVQYNITVSPNPDKILVEERESGRTLNIAELSDLDVTLLACISAILETNDLY